MEVMPYFSFLQSVWVVWVVVLFSGIVVWAYWPKNKGTFNSHAQMALRDDDTVPPSDSAAHKS